MSRLIQGQVSEDEFECLLRLTKFTSERKIDALRLHLVRGYNTSMAYSSCELKQSKFAEALVAINEKWSIHLDLLEASKRAKM
ncbi:PapB/FocB family fimbrial expression transcriptional regulator [Shewanella oncorhynchi]|jgi:hypothetical protein|uniref:PapB/FocB family fimbrial expression transcriptional regulator n=1 Tax=Shewanella oncorhynchi TaxID=2726434 RepID=UPI003D7AA391